jgi:hypothetical protein
MRARLKLRISSFHFSYDPAKHPRSTQRCGEQNRIRIRAAGPERGVNVHLPSVAWIKKAGDRDFAAVLEAPNEVAVAAYRIKSSHIDRVRGELWSANTFQFRDEIAADLNLSSD